MAESPLRRSSRRFLNFSPSPTASTTPLKSSANDRVTTFVSPSSSASPASPAVLRPCQDLPLLATSVASAAGRELAEGTVHLWNAIPPVLGRQGHVLLRL